MVRYFCRWRRSETLLRHASESWYLPVRAGRARREYPSVRWGDGCGWAAELARMPARAGSDNPPPQGGGVAEGDGGGGHGAEVIAYLPLRQADACHLPLAGEDCTLLSLSHARRGKAASSDDTTEDELGRSPSGLARSSAKPLRRLALGAYASSPIRSAAINASCGMLTEPYSRIFSLPFFCFSRSFFLRLASPP